jgi:hypothetical protein
MSLLTIQQTMRAWLTKSGPDEEHDEALPAGYRIYRNNYRTQLVRCLEASYPMLRDWLGPEAFLQASIQHIDNHPPHGWTLDAYGADFQSTLQDRYPHNPDLQELAWIEWSLSESFVATDAPVSPTSLLGELDWDNAGLCLAPSLRLHEATTNAVDLWHAWQTEESLPESEMLSVTGAMITWRHGFTCRLRRIDAIEHVALLLLRDDHRFAGLCTALVEHLGEEAGVRRAGEWLADWLPMGIVHCVSWFDEARSDEAQPDAPL